METEEPTFTSGDLQILFDALTMYIRSGEFGKEKSDHVEGLWHKLRWACTYPHLLTGCQVEETINFSQNKKRMRPIQTP